MLLVAVLRTHVGPKHPQAVLNVKDEKTSNRSSSRRDFRKSKKLSNHDVLLNRLTLSSYDECSIVWHSSVIKVHSLGGASRSLPPGIWRGLRVIYTDREHIPVPTNERK